MPPQGQKSGGNGGLIAGLGIGCLLLFALVGFGVYSVVNRTTKAAKALASAVASSTISDEGPVTTTTTSGGGAIKVTLKGPSFFRPRVGKALHFVGELVNSGSDPVSAPGAKVTLFDAAGTAVDSSICIASGVRALPVGESVPCWGLFSKAEEYKTIKAEGTGYPLYMALKLASLTMSDVTGNEPANTYAPYKVTGKVTNKSTFAAKAVWVAVGLYDEADKLVGAGQGPVAGNDLDASSAGKFEVNVYNVAAKPKRFEAKAFGYDK